MTFSFRPEVESEFLEAIDYTGNLIVVRLFFTNLLGSKLIGKTLGSHGLSPIALPLSLTNLFLSLFWPDQQGEDRPTEKDDEKEDKLSDQF
jgi:hypothetical protein